MFLFEYIKVNEKAPSDVKRVGKHYLIMLEL